MNARIWCAIAGCLVAASASYAQAPALVPQSGRLGFASGPGLTVPPAPLPPAATELPTPIPLGQPVGTACENNCVPTPKPRTRAIYSTVTRQVPARPSDRSSISFS